MKKTILCLSVLILFCGFAATSHAVEVEALGGVNIHGFISQGFLNSERYNYLTNDSKKGSFQFNEMGINFGKQLTDKLSIGVQFFARDLGDAANDKITLDWAYADYRLKDWLGLRAGKVKLPRGLYNEIRDMDMLRGPIILPQGIYEDLTRDTLIAVKGGCLYGYIPISIVGSLEYQALIGTMDMDTDSGLGKVMNSVMGGAATVEDSNAETMYAGSLRWNTPLKGLALKTTGFRLPTNTYMRYASFLPGIGGLTETIDTVTTEAIFSAEYIWKDLSLNAEYMTKRAESELKLVPSRGFTKKSEAYYVMASYRFLKWLEAGSYYSVFYPERTDKHGHDLEDAGKPDHDAWQKDAALFLRFDVNDNCSVKLEGHHVNGTAQVLGVDNSDRDRSSKNWIYYGAKVTFSF